MVDMNETQIRAGEEVLEFDPASQTDAGVVFIGRIRSPWKDRATCPRNIGSARDSGQGARIELAPGYARGLAGLQVGQPLMVVYWMHHARRDLIVQAPRHVEAPRGTFALRSPNRPNPLAMSAVRITALDPEAGTIGIDAIDCMDGTPLVDIKPWHETIDTPATGSS